jgi:hypothetical protein
MLSLALLTPPNRLTSPSMVVGNSGCNLPFTYDGIDYEFQLLGFNLGGQYLMETYAREGETQLAEIHAQFNQVSAVPVPAAAWLLGSGLLGLLPIARRKK